MKLSEELVWRGQVKDTTFKDVTWLDTARVFYFGMDCQSSDSLTIGNLAGLMAVRRFIKHGWKAVILVGGATSLIGDPGGKEEERVLTSREQIEANIAGIKVQITQILDGMDYTLVDNYDWFKDIGYLDFLRIVGKHFSMTELVQRDFIATRMGIDGTGISYAEFSYNMIQGYDFWHLYTQLGVELQIGGSDQWGNMLSGVPLVRKKEDAEVHAMSTPLVINKATGKKFGKSEGGAIWLDPDKTSPTQYYQFWINADDEGVEDYLKIYTELTKGEIDQIITTHKNNPGDRQAQKHLARESTTLLHGAEQMRSAEIVTEFLIGTRPLNEADQVVLDVLRTEIPALTVAADSSLLQALVDGGQAESISEARRLLKGNAVAINGQKTDSELFHETDFVDGRLLLKKGKKFRDTILVERG